MSAEDLGKAIRERRNELRLTQVELSLRGGVSEATIRRIEHAEAGETLRPSTFRRLDASLEWIEGSSHGLLHSGLSPEVMPTEWRSPASDDDRNWTALAKAVQTRRAELDLRQDDLLSRGGPSGGTVRNIEQVARNGYSVRTFVMLEQALGWPRGTVDDILAGRAREPEEHVAQQDVRKNSADRSKASTTSSQPLDDDDRLALSVGRSLFALVDALNVHIRIKNQVVVESSPLSDGAIWAALARAMDERPE